MATEIGGCPPHARVIYTLEATHDYAHAQDMAGSYDIWSMLPYKAGACHVGAIERLTLVHVLSGRVELQFKRERATTMKVLAAFVALLILGTLPSKLP